MYYSTYFSSKYMDFVSYYTCDKLVCTSGKGNRTTNKVITQGSPKHLSTKCLFHQHWFLVVPRRRTLVIYIQNIWFHQEYQNIINCFDNVLRYINKVKY